MNKFSKIVTRRTVYNTLSCKDTEYKEYRDQPYFIQLQTNSLKLTFILSNQTVDFNHIGPMAMLVPHQYCQMNITVQGVQLTGTIEVTRSYPGNLCLWFVGIQAWRRDFHSRCECSVSDPRGSKN